MNRARWVLMAVTMVLMSSGAFGDDAPAGPTTKSVSHVVSRSGTHVWEEPNGLTVIVKENHFAPVMTVRVVVKTGSMLEGEFLGAGISHLAEHLVSGGTTTTRTEEESRRILEELGHNSNAMTSTHWTMYYIDTTAANAERAIDLVSDWVLNAAITQEEFDREHAVVTRELERGEDDMNRRMHELATQNRIRVHPSRHPVIGYLPQLKDLTREDVVKYHAERYVPNNMVVGVVGAVEAESAHRMVARAFGGGKRQTVVSQSLPEEPVQVSAREVVGRLAGLGVTRMRMDFPTVSLTDQDMYPLDLLSFILSEGESSRLVRELRDRRGLVSMVNTWSYTPGFMRGMFGISMQTRPGGASAVREAVWRELERVQKQGVTATELTQAKTQKISEHVFANQTVGDQCDDMVLNYVAVCDPDFSASYVERIQKVTTAEVQRVAREYLSREKESLTVLEPGPTETPEPAPQRQPADVDVATKHVLDNGLRVILKRKPGAGLVSIQAYGLGGLRAEDPDKAGVARLAARMLLRGTTTMTAEAIARSFEAMGGSIAAASGNNTFNVSATVLARDMDKAMAGVADVLRNPTFPREELDGQRRLTLDALARQKDSLPTLAALFFRARMYPGSVYGLDPLGTPQSLEAINREDLTRFYAKWGRPGNIVLAVYGEIDADATLAAVKRRLGTWTGEDLGRERLEVAGLMEPVNGVQRIEGDKETAVVYVGYRGATVSDVADRDAMTVLDTAMSGYLYPGGWLHEELRGKGLVYEVHAYNASWLDTGFFAAYAVCEPAKVPEVKAIIVGAMDRAREGRITQKELDLARTMIVTTELLDEQSPSSQAMEAAVNELYGLGYDFQDSLAQRIEAVQLQDVVRVARKYLTTPVVTITTPRSAHSVEVVPVR